MFCRVEVLGSVAVLGRIATADFTAHQTHPQVNPGVPGLNTLFADVLVGRPDLDLVEMRTLLFHFSSSTFGFEFEV
jgi:hypothetical protein